MLAYLLVFPAFAVLRRRRPGLPRPFLVPGGRAGAAVVTIAATGWSALAAACLLWPGLGTAHPDAHLPAGFAGQRGLFESANGAGRGSGRRPGPLSGSAG